MGRELTRSMPARCPSTCAHSSASSAGRLSLAPWSYCLSAAGPAPARHAVRPGWQILCRLALGGARHLARMGEELVLELGWRGRAHHAELHLAAGPQERRVLEHRVRRVDRGPVARRSPLDRDPFEEK